MNTVHINPTISPRERPLWGTTSNSTLAISVIATPTAANANLRIQSGSHTQRSIPHMPYVPTSSTTLCYNFLLRTLMLIGLHLYKDKRRMLSTFTGHCTYFSSAGTSTTTHQIWRTLSNLLGEPSNTNTYPLCPSSIFPFFLVPSFPSNVLPSRYILRYLNFKIRLPKQQIFGSHAACVAGCYCRALPRQRDSDSTICRPMLQPVHVRPPSPNCP